MIDKDILISDLNDISEILKNNGYCSWCKSIQKAIDMLKDQETANLYKCPNCGTWVSAENVVRCKDCAYLNRDPRFMNYGYCRYFKDEFYVNVKPDKNFYCGEGKRQL